MKSVRSGASTARSSGDTTRRGGASTYQPPSPTGGDSPVDDSNKNSARSKGTHDEDEDEGPVYFVDRNPVQVFFGIMVIGNAFFIGFDTHLRATESGNTGQSMMVIFEICFFVVFLIELILRLAADRSKFPNNSWNLIDLVLVVGSGVDLLFELVLRSDEGATQDMGKLRAIRLLKITRLVRMVRIFRVFRFKMLLRVMRGLILLILSIVRAMASLGWVCLILFMTTYLFAIVTTEFLGLANDDGDAEIDAWFGDMFKSMFTLIQLSTLEEWGYIARHVGHKFGFVWQLFFLMYVLATNLILMNVVLATLIENVLELSEEVKEAHEEGHEDAPSWMRTPSSLESEPEEDDKDKNDKEGDAQGGQPGANALVAGAGGLAGGVAVQQQTIADRLATQTLSEFFDLAATYVGVEGINQRKLVTSRGLNDALQRQDVRNKIFQACPALQAMEVPEMAQKIWDACPKRLDQDGLSRQELAESILSIRGDLSMNHFVVISQALQKLETHIEHELTHLNKHQRKMNRRFLKLRHRLRKVYHFDGAPRKMVEMVNEMKRRAIAEAAEAQLKGQPTPAEKRRQAKAAGEASDGSSEVDLSDSSEDSDDPKAKKKDNW
mmetsp:Transcript_127383/g.317981  ORF Transcript_127383/g.317981 Transcript_127383/m.317981 type:complete len:608 (+) Transcript_127383:33-1856(+)